MGQLAEAQLKSIYDVSPNQIVRQNFAKTNLWITEMNRIESQAI